ncbi:hypothetical protein EDD11_001627 [Mortierella claussenii]|nr:hypothetical protein EDD11_001627 [Mortierella claussenii]
MRGLWLWHAAQEHLTFGQQHEGKVTFLFILELDTSPRTDIDPTAQQELNRMDLPIVKYSKSEYIETDTGNKVSRKSVICGSQNIILGGKTILQTGSVIRGDLRRTGPGQAVVVSVGRYCFLSQGCVIRPPCKTYKGAFSYYPMKIGDHVTIGEGSIVQAASIGSFVSIGKNCVIGKFAIIKECARIEDNTVIPPNSVVPSFTVYSGSPGRIVDELPESIQEIYEARTKDRYAKFVSSTD